MRLFRWFILRRVLQEPLRSLTTTIGIALGIAVIIAIQLTNASSLAGFETAIETISGQTSLEITATGLGVDDGRLADLGWLRQFGSVAPVIEGDVSYRPAGGPVERMRVLGIDILRDQPFRDYRLLQWAGGTGQPRPQEFLELLIDPASVILTAKFASPRQLGVGSTLTVTAGDRVVPLRVRGVLRDEGPARVLEGNLLLMDIAAAQHLLDRFGRIDRLDLRLDEGIDVDATQSTIAARLPDGLTVERPAQRGRQVEQMLAAFHLNLTALSYVALLVGLFLVYNAVSVAVLSRRAEIGALRALGVTRGQVRRLFLAEAAALASIGALAGLMLGRVLADAAVALTANAVSAIYIATAAAPPSLQLWHVVLALTSAVPLSLLAALVPAQEAAGVPPTAAIRGSDQVEARTRLSRTRLGIAGSLLGLAAWLSTRGPINGLPLLGYASAVAVIFGASLLVPAVLTSVVARLVAVARRLLRVEDWLAATNLSAAVPRLSISVAALAVSLSMMVAIAIMIGSFRETVVYWIQQTLQADLFISPASRRQPGAADTLSPELVELVSRHPDVDAVDRFRVTEVPYGATGIRVGGGDFNVLLTHGSLLFKAPSDAREAMRRAIGTDAVVASEAFMLKHGHRLGETVTLPTDAGPAAFLVVAVYYDYSSDRGVVMMDRQTFARHFDDRSVSGVTVYLRPGVDADAARTRLLTAIGDRYQVFINTNRALRAEILRIFDSTFAITYALEVIAIVVAMLGVAGTLLTLILEREHELRILRLVGTGRSQITRMVVGEALVLGAISQGIGLVVGFALSLLLVYVINVQSFGWTIQFHLPIGFLVQSSVAMMVATALAGLYPAARAVGLTMRQEE